MIPGRHFFRRPDYGACPVVPREHRLRGAVPLRVYAAGSLREALTEIARLYESRTGLKTQLTLARRPACCVNALKKASRHKCSHRRTPNIRNACMSFRPAAAAGCSPLALCATSCARWPCRQLNAEPDQLLELMLDPAVKLGTSTPKADPSGDYAWALFRKADALRPGAYAALDAKALKLTGSPEAPRRHRAGVFMNG